MDDIAEAAEGTWQELRGDNGFCAMGCARNGTLSKED
jgi:hypothetical protein